jgi:hypothetical protein
MEPRILRTSDTDGRAIVRVEMANQRGFFAVMDAADFDDWIKAGRSPRMITNKNGPMTGTYRVVVYDRSVAGGLAGVARAILGLGKGQVVQYLNSDRLDLRRCNLAIRRGRATGQTKREVEVATSSTKAPPRRTPVDLGSLTAAVV